MSKSTYHSPLPSSAVDLDIENFMDNNTDPRRQSSLSDKRIHNVNYVRHVLRRFFGTYNKKPSSTQDLASEQSPTRNLTSPILIHPCLQYDKRTKFSGELLLDWFLTHFEGRCENLPLIRQVIFKCCTCLLSLGVLRVENDGNHDLFQVGKIGFLDLNTPGK